MEEPREFLKKILEDLPIGVWFIEPDETVSFCNSACRRILGLPDNQKTFKLRDLKAWRAKTGQKVKTDEWPCVLALSGKKTVDEELLIEAFDGKKRAVRASAVPVFENKNPAWAISVIEDITLKKEAETELKKTGELLEKLFESIDLLIAYMDRDFNFIKVNRAYAEKSMGKPPEFYVGKNHFDLFPNAENEAIFRDVVTTGKPYYFYAKPFEYAHAPERGTTYWNWSLHPIKEPDGTISGAVLSLMDITEHKKREEQLLKMTSELEENREKLDSILNNMGNAVYLTDLEGRHIFVNRKFTEFTGITQGEAYGKTNFDLFPEETARSFSENDLKAIKADGPIEFEEHTSFGGVERIFLTIRFPLKDLDGKACCVCGVSTDITHLKKTEEALQKSEQMLRNAQRIAHVGNWDWDIENNRIYASDEIYRIFGQPKEEFVTIERFYESLHPDDREPIRASIMETLSGRASAHPVNYRVLLPDGEEKLIHEESELFRDSTGRPLRLVGTLQDITELWRANSKLEESERKYRNLVENSLIGVFITNIDGEILYANNAILRMFEFDSAGEFTKTGVLARYKDPEKRKKLIEALLKHGWIEGFEFEGVTKKGGTRNLLLSARLDGEIINGTILDITERKQMEEEIKRLNIELEKRVEERTSELNMAIEDLAAANRDMHTFTYSVAHDLRSPLRLIDGFSMLLIKKYSEQLDSSALDTLMRIRGATKRMGQLIDDLLNLSTVMRAQISPGIVNVSALASSILTDLKKADPARKVHTKAEDGLKALGDARLIRIVLENLLGNAWKYTAKNPEAAIEFGKTALEKGMYTFYVADNGIGFDMKFADRIFEPFHRLHSAEEFPGTGIGLATVKRIIQKHGGSAWAKSEPGKGAAFYFTLKKGGD